MANGIADDFMKMIGLGKLTRTTKSKPAETLLGEYEAKEADRKARTAKKKKAKETLAKKNGKGLQ